MVEQSDDFVNSLGFGESHMEGRFLEEIHLFPLLLFGCI